MAHVAICVKMRPLYARFMLYFVFNMVIQNTQCEERNELARKWVLDHQEDIGDTLISTTVGVSL